MTSAAHDDLTEPTEPAEAPPLLRLVSDDVADGTLTDEQLGSRIVGLAGRVAAATCRWLLLVAEFDRREAWNAFGLGSTARWLSHHCGISHRTALEHVRVARALHTHDRLAEEMGAGRVSYSHVRAISRVVDPDDTELVDALVESAEHGTVGQLEEMVRGLRTVDRNEQEDADRRAGLPVGPKDTIDTRTGPDSRWHMSARLAPERGAVVDAALDAVARAEKISKVDALERLAEIALAVLADDGRMPRELRGDERAAIVIHLDAKDVPPAPDPTAERSARKGTGLPFARLADGPGLPDPVAYRLLCDGRLRTVVYETDPDGRRRVLDVGRCHRLVTRKQFRALVARDGRRCAVPGCESRRRLHVHHVVHWLHGGLTEPDNEVLVCEVHHLKVHDGEIDVRATKPGRFRWFRADGGALVDHVDPGSLAATPAPADADHPDVAADAAESRWDGTRLDRDYAVACLSETKARRRRAGRRRRPPPRRCGPDRLLDGTTPACDDGPVFDIATTVTAWLDDNDEVLVARVLTGSGLAGREAAAVAAWTTTGQGPVGSRLAARAQASGDTGRVQVAVTDDEAEGVGLACGGTATVLVQRATDLPDGFWSAFRRGGPAALVDTAEGTTTFDASDVPERFARVFGRGVSQVAEIGDEAGSEILTTYWPRTRLLVVGGGPVASALLAQADLLGWSGVVAEDLATALDLLQGFGGADAVAVLSHDREVDGPLLAAAVASPVGYVGAMGSRHTQVARAEWFAAHDVTEHLDRIHGPAGLDIGGFGPAEIALSITAEIVAVRSGRG